jgi:SAM-dependent methyltransferase
MDESSEHYLLARYRAMLAKHGLPLTRETRILDFCCGGGEYVSEFRNAGYDVHGFEPYGGIVPNAPFFKSFEWKSPYGGRATTVEDLPDLSTDWASTRLPYDDQRFDFIFSTEVMEHIADHDSVLREMRRILKPGGICIHSFPSRYRLIEPHVLIPLGGIIKWKWWYRLWGHMGIGAPNKTGRDLDRDFVVLRNHWYAKGSLHYPPPRKLRKIGPRHFAVSDFDPELWNSTRKPSWLYTHTEHVVWVLSNPRQLQKSPIESATGVLHYEHIEIIPGD